MQVYEETITGAHVVRFLEHLGRTLPGGKFTIFWDGAPIHRGQAVQQFLALAPAGRFQIEPLPAYAPDLNPDEGVWDHLKGDDLANVSCLDQRRLRGEIRAGTQWLQRHPERVRAFFSQAGYG
jgi:transposase